MALMNHSLQQPNSAILVHGAGENHSMTSIIIIVFHYNNAVVKSFFFSQLIISILSVTGGRVRSGQGN